MLVGISHLALQETGNRDEYPGIEETMSPEVLQVGAFPGGDKS